MRQNATGDSWIPGLPAFIADRIIPEPNTGCWLWLGGAVNEVNGYAYIAAPALGFPHITVHRLVFIMLRCGGKRLPRRIHVHHEVCRIKLCCNPDHVLPKDAGAHSRDHRLQENGTDRGWHSAAANERRRNTLNGVSRTPRVRPEPPSLGLDDLVGAADLLLRLTASQSPTRSADNSAPHGEAAAPP